MLTKKNKYISYSITYTNFLFIKSWEESVSKKYTVFICDFIDYKYRKYGCVFLVLLKSILPLLLFVYFTLMLLKYILLSLLLTRCRKQKFKKLYVNTGNGFKIAVCENMIDRNDFVLEFPYKLTDKIVCNRISIANIASLKVIFISYIDSLKSFLIFRKKKGAASFIYLFTSFNYFLLYNSLRSIADVDELLISNQKDRWAYLIGTLDFHEKTILQHGTVIAKGVPASYMRPFVKYSIADKLFYVDMPYKLIGFTKIVSFSSLEYKYIQLSEHVKQQNQVNISVGYNLSLSNIFDDNKDNILIIGNSNQRVFEEEQLINFFDQNTKFRLLLKPHPVFSKSVYRKFANKKNFYLLDDNCFPVATYVISYYSTLALEYENIHAKVIYYDDICLDNSNVISFDALLKYLI